MDIKAVEVHRGKSFARVELHFSGGLKGYITSEGVSIFPISHIPDQDALLFSNLSDCLSFAVNSCNQKVLGVCEEHLNDSEQEIMSVWRTGIPSKSSRLTTADLWQAISYQADLKKDYEYSQYSSYLSTSLKRFGLALRDISNHLNKQLRNALQDQMLPGELYSNALLLNLFNDFYLALSELASARDYISKIVAIQIQAPSEVDSLSKLKIWVNQKQNEQHRENPMIAELLKASGTKTAPNWLGKFGDMRNEKIHRRPMGEDDDFSSLVLENNVTEYGDIMTIKLASPKNKVSSLTAQIDPLFSISEFAINCEVLFRRLTVHAKYSATLPNITI